MGARDKYDRSEVQDLTNTSHLRRIKAEIEEGWGAGPNVEMRTLSCCSVFALGGPARRTPNGSIARNSHVGATPRGPFFGFRKHDESPGPPDIRTSRRIRELPLSTSGQNFVGHGSEPEVSIQAEWTSEDGSHYGTSFARDLASTSELPRASAQGRVLFDIRDPQGARQEAESKHKMPDAVVGLHLPTDGRARRSSVSTAAARDGPTSQTRSRGARLASRARVNLVTMQFCRYAHRQDNPSSRRLIERLGPPSRRQEETQRTVRKRARRGTASFRQDT